MLFVIYVLFIGYCSDTESYDHSYHNSDDLYRFSENEMNSSRKNNNFRYNTSNVIDLFTLFSLKLSNLIKCLVSKIYMC